MKCSLLAACAILTAASAAAQPRPSTLEMTCGQAAALVASQGGIVLGTGGYTYDRFVAHRGFCQERGCTDGLGAARTPELPSLAL